jgi:hypothetical protein
MFLGHILALVEADLHSCFSQPLNILAPLSSRRKLRIISNTPYLSANIFASCGNTCDKMEHSSQFLSGLFGLQRLKTNKGLLQPCLQLLLANTAFIPAPSTTTGDEEGPSMKVTMLTGCLLTLITPLLSKAQTLFPRRIHILV